MPRIYFKGGGTRRDSTRVYVTVNEKLPRGGTHPNINYSSSSDLVRRIGTDTKERGHRQERRQRNGRIV